MPNPAVAIDDETYDRLCAAVGEMVFQWPFLESALDFCATVVFHVVGGRHIEDQLPRAFTRKLRFLDLCFRRVSDLADYQEEVSVYTNLARTLSQTRNTVIHGTFEGFSGEPDYVLGFKLPVFTDANTFITYEHVNVRLQDILDAVNVLSALIDALHQVARRLMDRFLADKDHLN